jgi:hypothetical protein
MSDKSNLSAKRRSSGGLHRSDDEIAKATGRLIRALGDRLSDDDPSGARLLLLIEDEVRTAWALAVAGWRESGFSDGRIGEELGVTKQAVQQRWPRDIHAREAQVLAGP